MSNAPFIIIGLGNPGAEYTQTRHNAGFWFVDLLAGSADVFTAQKKLHALQYRMRVAGEDCLLLKPQTFMNLSGQSVRAAIDWYKLSSAEISQRVLVVHDELDLPPGTVRIKQSGGHGGNNGLRDIERHLGTRDYLRLRIGVGHPGHASRVSGYLTIGRPSAGDQRAIAEAMLDARDCLPSLLQGDVPQAMKQLHTSKND